MKYKLINFIYPVLHIPCIAAMPEKIEIKYKNHSNYNAYCQEQFEIFYLRKQEW